MNLNNLFEFFQKMVWLISFGVTIYEVLRVEISKKPCWISKKITCIFKGWHLANRSSKSNNPWHFLKELNKIFCIWRTSTLNSIAPSSLHYIVVCKIHIYIRKMRFQACQYRCSFSTKKLLPFGIWHVLFLIWYQYGPYPQSYKSSSMRNKAFS